MMKRLPCTLLFLLCFTALSWGVSAQPEGSEETKQAILDALPHGVTAETASSEDIARAVIEVIFTREGELEPRVTRATIALGELEQSGVFSLASGPGRQSPTLYFYNSMINLASASGRGMTPQYIIRVSNAMVEGLNYLNRVE